MYVCAQVGNFYHLYVTLSSDEFDFFQKNLDIMYSVAYNKSKESKENQATMKG